MNGGMRRRIRRNESEKQKQKLDVNNKPPDVKK